MKTTKAKASDSDVTTVAVAIGDLVPSEYNPRKISGFDFDKLKDSIKKFGLPVPIVANSRKERMNVVIGGHQRLKAAQELGMKTVPVVYVDLSEKDEKILNLSLNRISGEFDDTMLKSIFSGMTKADLDITGFYEHEVAKIMREMEDLGKDVSKGTMEVNHICPKCNYKF